MLQIYCTLKTSHKLKIKGYFNKIFVIMGINMNINTSTLIELLIKEYPDAKCSLDFKTPFQMLVAVMLSAQCTDERVNQTTPYIFAKYNTPADFANANIEELEKLVYPCGFYKTKTKNLIACGKIIVEKFNGEVPQSMEELTSLPGIGRKCANVIMLNAFSNPVGIAVDTHAKRISNRIGLSYNSDPLKIEQDLLLQFDKKYLSDINHLFVYHGRKICTSRKPKCNICPIYDLCEKNGI